MQLIPLSTATAAYRRVYFTTVQSADLQSRVTGALTSPVARVSQNGAASAAATNAVTEVDAANFPGLRYLELTAAEVNALGIVTVRISATGVEPRELVAQVVTADLYAALLGVNVTHWKGDAVPLTNEPGVPLTDLTRFKGITPSDTTSGLVQVHVAAMGANVVTAASVAPDAVTEIQSGLATTAALATAQTSLTALDTKLGAPAGASVSADIAAVKVDTGSTLTKVTAIETDVNNLEKVATGRWKIQGTQLILYELDGTTPYKTYNLLDDTGAPSNIRIFERVPV